MLDFLQDADRKGFPTLSKLSEDDVCTIWACVSEFIDRQMTLQKGVQIPGLGTFTLSRQKLNIGINNLTIIQRPVFLLSEKCAQIHGLKYSRIFTTGDIPIIPLNFIALSLSCPFKRDTIESCVRETLMVFSRSVANRHNVEFTFKDVGSLMIRNMKVKMKFYKDFVNRMDGSGALVKSLSNRPGTADSVMSSAEDGSPRPRSCSALLFPRIEMKTTDKAAAMETIPEEPKAMESGEEPTISQPIEKEEAEGQEPITSRQENSPAKRLLNRQIILPARVTGISLSEDLAQITKPKTAPERMGSSLSMSIPRTDPNVNQSNVRIRTAPMCQDHCRAGQELCYLCLQRAQKNVPVYFTEERRLKEKEEERVLQQYQHMRDQEAIHKYQLASQANREQREKDALYNKGVAEATRKERTTRNMEFYKSYIFQKRPLTPPALLKQEPYYQSLTKQMAERRGKEAREKQDQDLLGRLEQVQLADELAAQRAKYLREKEEQMICYKKALDTQINIKPNFVLPADTAATEPIFGRNDMTNEKLVERKRRAQEVARHQLQVAADHERLAILNDLVQQRKESDMLQRAKEQLLLDRAAQFEKMDRLHRGLQEDWTQSLEMKRRRDQNEERFIKARSHLLLDQFEKYDRCFQCKRRTTNCGESNVWRDTRYIPGARLMV